QIALMMCETPYAGYNGEYFSMPVRNVVPKPVQRPHPPMWLACSTRQTIHLAAKLGPGALTFAFIDPSEATHWVTDYYETFKNECVPIAQSVNPNIAMVTGLMCHENEEQAVARGLEGFQFFGYALAHYYLFGAHVPGRTNVFEGFQRDGLLMPSPANRGGIGTPDQVRAHLSAFEETGVDQVVFIQQGGNNRHDDICASLDLFAARVLPDFKARENARARRRAEELAPYVAQAMARKQPRESPREIAEVMAYGRNVAEGGGGVYPTRSH